MDKHETLINNSAVAPKLVGSITTKGQNPTDEDNFQGGFHCVPGQREQPKQCPRTYNLIHSLYSNRPHLQKISQKKCITEPIVEPAKQQNFSNMFLSSKLIKEHHKLQHKVLIFEFLGLKTKQLSQFTEFIYQKSQLKIHGSTTSILTVESALTGFKQLTTGSNDDLKPL